MGFIVKRIDLSKGPAVRLAGRREAYFGGLLRQLDVPMQDCSDLELSDGCLRARGRDHLSRFVESFEVSGTFG